jgi:hypothetical protein
VAPVHTVVGGSGDQADDAHTAIIVEVIPCRP